MPGLCSKSALVQIATSSPVYALGSISAKQGRQKDMTLVGLSTENKKPSPVNFKQGLAYSKGLTNASRYYFSNESTGSDWGRWMKHE